MEVELKLLAIAGVRVSLIVLTSLTLTYVGIFLDGVLSKLLMLAPAFMRPKGIDSVPYSRYWSIITTGC